jgi:putative Mn2+ efflux pump MntP
MKKQVRRQFKMMGRILGTTLIISLLIMLVGFVYYWNSPGIFSNAFLIAGAILIILGIAFATNGFSQRMAAEIAQRRYRIMFFLTVTGLLLIGIATLIDNSLIIL